MVEGFFLLKVTVQLKYTSVEHESKISCTILPNTREFNIIILCTYYLQTFFKQLEEVHYLMEENRFHSVSKTLLSPN